MTKKEIILEPKSIDRLQSLCGPMSANIIIIEDNLNVEVSGKNFDMFVSGDDKDVDSAIKAIKKLYDLTYQNKKIKYIEPEDVFLVLREIAIEFSDNKIKNIDEYQSYTQPVSLVNEKVRTRSTNQSMYVNYILNNDVTIGVGPAGTGKSFLAIAVALDYLVKGIIDKIIITRPAVESGENLGFLPGEIDKKLEPYLKPLYDSIEDILGSQKLRHYMENGTIEIAPLAYMRGRTFKKSFVILDEAQNTTRDQMKLFLTRLGFGSKMVVNGDLTQIDLRDKSHSGLIHALDVLDNIPEVKVHRFSANDIIRHPVINIIVNAYDYWEAQKSNYVKPKTNSFNKNKLFAALTELLDKQEENNKENTNLIETSKVDVE